MTFTCITNLPHSTKPSDRRFWQSKGNTKIHDGDYLSSATFRSNATDETIMRSYLRCYQFSPNDDGTYAPLWMEITIHQRPEDPDYDKVYYVRLNPTGTRATVTDRQPTGELRCDGYRY